MRGIDEESALTVVSDSLVLAKAGVNEYERYRTLYGAILGDEHIPEVTDPKEVAWVRFMPVKELVGAAKDGTMEFVDGFFTDAAFALDALRSHPLTPETVKESINTNVEILRDHIALR